MFLDNIPILKPNRNNNVYLLIVEIYILKYLQRLSFLTDIKEVSAYLILNAEHDTSWL